MWFWWFILLCDCSIPLIMMITGRRIRYHCPKKIHGIIGYRTKRSMKNMDTWKFAHAHAGNLWWELGIGLFVPTLLIHIPFYGASDNALGSVSTVLIAVQLSILIGSVYQTEAALSQAFNEDGTMR